MDSLQREHSFGQFLLERTLLTQTLIEQARKVSLQTRDPLVKSLAKLGFVPESTLANALAEFVQLPRHTGPVRIAVPLSNLSLEFLRHHALAPLCFTDETIVVAVANPLDDAGVRGVKFATNRTVAATVAALSQIESALDEVRDGSRVDEPTSESRALESLESLTDLASDAPAIRLVQRLITLAVDQHASDIHIEPTDSGVNIRFRLDGVLQDVETLAPAFAGSVVSRIKVMAHLDIAERRLPQDGRLKITTNGKGIDFRVATSPTLHGESLVLRILDRQEVELDFLRLGFDSETLPVMLAAVRRPYGIILSTGPTGSGKTTTLYTALKELNSPDRKIITVEDPIEYTLHGVNQTQVKPQIGYNFATALRAFLRQDPDVLMVGEIRDRETAEVAIQAALTGHLLLSTLHTNSAAAAVTRLLDMGIDDFLLTSTLNLVIGQRLVRRLCPHCRESYLPDAQLLDRLGRKWKQEAQLFRAVGCKLCAGVGYAGRTGLLELLELSEPIRREILARADADTIEAAAVERGMRTMFSHGLDLVSRGETSLEEILRTTRPGG
jgi:general secretion pathway protein E